MLNCNLVVTSHTHNNRRFQMNRCGCVSNLLNLSDGLTLLNTHQIAAGCCLTTSENGRYKYLIENGLAHDLLNALPILDET